MYTHSSFILLHQASFKLKLLNLIVLIILFSLISCTGSFGPVKKIADLKVVGNKICFLDEKTVGKKKPVIACRLYIVDAENGNQLKKEQIGNNSKLLISSGNKILIGNDKGYLLYNVEKLVIEKDLSKELLERDIPQFNDGIDEMKFLYNIVEISTKTGQVYRYDPFTGSVIGKGDVKPLDLNFNTYYYNRIYNFNNGFEKDLFLLKSEKTSSKRQIVQSVTNQNDGSKMVSNDYFIEGSFVGLLDEDKLMLISSYNNTDRESQVLTCLDYDLKTKWRINKTDFDIDESEINFLNFSKFNDNLILTAGKYLLSIELNTGKLKWKQTY